MKQKLLVPVINENLSFEDASSIYDKSLPDQAYNMVSKSYYPYFLFQANYKVPILLLQRQLSVNCMIDALNGQAATTDNFRVFETEVAHEDVLANSIDKKQAKKIEEPTPTIQYENTVSLNAETTSNLFNDLGYDLMGVRACLLYTSDAADE